jgi:hypothetical protein
MIDQLLAPIAEHAYRRSDVAYRLSLVREFLEYIFFTKRETGANKENVEAFIVETKKPAADATFLRALPPTFLSAFTQESFYSLIDQCAEAANHMKTLSLSVPVSFTPADIEVLGTWVQKEVEPHVLIDVDVDPDIIVGCRIGWENRLHDYSFDHFFSGCEAALSERLKGLKKPPVESSPV